MWQNQEETLSREALEMASGAWPAARLSSSLLGQADGVGTAS